MQLGSDVHIPDGLLAANALLAGNSRQGVPTSTQALHPGFEFAISSTYMGFQFRCYESASDPVDAPSNLVPKNPCAYQGRALPPSGYAAAGKAANGNPLNFALDASMGFPRGHYLDAQPLTGAPYLQAAAYGNYAYGVYMQAAGFTLSQALSGANGYAFLSGAKYGPANGPLDPNYSSIPAANVANITNGFNAQANGTTCHE